MKYEKIEAAVFKSRPNRFIAHVETERGMEVCHVKNTGRCRELLVPDARIWVQRNVNPARKTALDLIAVQKGDLLINMDSQIPNRVAEEWIRSGHFAIWRSDGERHVFSRETVIRPETRYGDSRIDLYLEDGDVRMFLEIKGVTLEEDGVARFPDAPTERGVKHVHELMRAREDGYEAGILFIIQMKGVCWMEPNDRTHPAFGEALRDAKQAGVHIMAADCLVEPDSICADQGGGSAVMTEETSLEQIVMPLLSWYDGHARVLPWRENTAPYRVWVSEIMLQQTRVEAVKPFFERFMKALPNVSALAACPEDELLKLWEGLGYYNRVRNMQKAAQVIMTEYSGEFPADFEKLLALPGIGSYTAGAISSIAFGIPMPAVDGNVLRVISRVKASYEDVLKQSVKNAMEAEIREVIPKERAGDFNQALIEIGAIVCVPNGKAKCEECPLAFCCRAKAEGIVDELPKKKAKKERRIEDRTVLILKDGDRVAIRKRPAKGLLAGLYELPNLDGNLSEQQVLEQVKEWGLSPLRILPLAGAKHIFSHVEWHMTGYAVSLEETDHMEDSGFLFIETKETESSYPIPAAFAAYAEYLDIALGEEKYRKGKEV